MRKVLVALTVGVLPLLLWTISGTQASADSASGPFAVITAAGRAAIERAAPAHVETVRRLVFDELTPDQLATLTELTDGVLDRLHGPS